MTEPDGRIVLEFAGAFAFHTDAATDLFPLLCEARRGRSMLADR